jgi:hypothetical protein
MKTKKSFLSGTIDKYKTSLVDCQQNKETFTTISSGLSRKIVFPSGTQLKYFGSPNKERNLISGAFLVTMVQREIDKYVEEHGVPSCMPVRDVQQFNLGKIKKVLASKKRVPVVGIDINACYWNTAHNLGYISDKLWKRGLDACKKEGLLISIGCLNKMPLIKRYVNGVLVETTYDYDYHNKYSPFYWNIIYKTYELMMESFEMFKDNWYMFLTDCLFVDVKSSEVAKKFISEKGYSTKSQIIELKKFDGFRLEWIELKEDKPKKIYASNRDIVVSHALWSINKGMTSTPLSN